MAIYAMTFRCGYVSISVNISTVDINQWPQCALV